MKADVMNPADFKDWLPIINFVGTALLSCFVFFFKYDKSNTKRIEQLEALSVEKSAEHKARLDVIDEKLKHVPSSSETAALTERIDALHGVIATLQKSVERQSDFLMQNK
jgi:hypothetical protein